MAGAIRLEFDLPGPPERLWSLLTDRDQLAAWFMETDFVPEVGRRFMAWPVDLPGVDGPASGVVLELDAPHRLVLGWQGPGRQTSMTWTLHPHEGGTTLRVVESGHLGPDLAERVRTFQRLFGVNLAGLLHRPFGAGPADPAFGAGIAGGAVGAGTAGGAGAADGAVHDQSQRRRRVLAAVVAVVIVLLVGVGVVRLGRHDAQGAGSLPGLAPEVAGSGNSPGTAAAGTPSSGSTPRGGVTVARSSGAYPSATPSASGAPAGGGPETALRVTSSTSSALLTLTAVITVHNDGGGVARWDSVGLTLNGLNLTVSTDSTVSHQPRPPVHCFYPTAPVADVAAAGVFQFTVTVTGTAGTLVPAIKSLTVDSPACA